MFSSNHETTNPITLGEAIERCCKELETSDAFFGHGTDNAWDEAVQLVLAVARLPANSGQEVLQSELRSEQPAELRALLHRRIHEQLPLPYLLGRAWFAGLEFLCDQRAIVPRSPLAELILNGFQPWYFGPAPRRVLDLCCGGGCIGLAVAHYYPNCQVDLVDIDRDALALSHDNRERLDLGEERVRIIQSDGFADLDNTRYDIILTNPPYVDALELESMPREYHAEPALALASGADGLDLTQSILASALDFLSETGLLIGEVGHSWRNLERRYPTVPFTWVECEGGGEGVFVMSVEELQKYSDCWQD